MVLILLVDGERSRKLYSNGMKVTKLRIISSNAKSSGSSTPLLHPTWGVCGRGKFAQYAKF
jgi:hypothetical protein